uniref:Elongin-C n=1 Tax=Rhodosorus marinus TaxID=101924 RepID=A0A7S0G543_9RHOD|mmetsp:Transcript_20142/g.29249  ORF Transcript_20142/g.29249 Transcript_20142/m.29249 type:complete len:103 (+) Transcript_20142:209-517(+)
MEGGDVPPGYVCLVSCDRHEFLIERKYAEVSKLVKRTLESGFGEALSRRIELPTVSKECLLLVCQFFYYRIKYKDVRGPKPEFEIPLKDTVDLMMASDFLDA